MLSAEQEQAGGMRLSVIIAEESAAANLWGLFAVLQPSEHPQVEFLVCSANVDCLREHVPDLPNVRLVAGATNARIPHLWRDGLHLAQAECVALTTAHCVPASDWLQRLLGLSLVPPLVAVGGAIRNVQPADALGRAIYAMRYCNYTPAREPGACSDLAADNALYRRRDILELEALLHIGFWEPSFHEVFLKDGKELRFDPELLVIHHNRYGARDFMRQRFSHGIEFGLARAASIPRSKCLLMILLGPLLPLVFLRKLRAKARADSGIELGCGADLFWLTCFVCAWCFGEWIGYGKSLPRRTSSWSEGAAQ